MLDLVDRALALSRTRLFSGLPDEALLELAEAATGRAAAVGEPLEPGALYVVAGGPARGAVLGARSVLGGDEALVSPAAGELVRLERDDVLDALALHPPLAARLCELLGVSR
jgi:hypothetical protein